MRKVGVKKPQARPPHAFAEKKSGPTRYGRAVICLKSDNKNRPAFLLCGAGKGVSNFFEIP